MENQALIVAPVMFVILVVCLIYRKIITTHQEDKVEFDLIIQFNPDSYVDITNNKELNQLAEWTKYGEFGYRGFCAFNKEDTEHAIIKALQIEPKDFKVIHANLGLCLPRS